MAARATVSSWGAMQLLEAARRRGADAEALCRSAEVDLAQLQDRERRLPLSRLHALWAAAMRRLGAPGFPLEVAAAFRPDATDLLWFATLTSATLGEAFGRFARYRAVCVGGSSWEAVERAGVVRLTFVPAGPPDLGGRAAAEHALAELVNASRLLAAEAWTPVEVTLAHRAPADCSAHERFFAAPLRWEAERYEIRLTPELWARPLPKADPHLAAFFARHFDAQLDRGVENIVTLVNRHLAAALSGGPPRLESVAERLTMSPRTLKRRLRDEGTSFQSLLDDTRRRLATRYLDDPHLAVGEVAYLLGFSEPSTFHRAFKRWLGTTPQEYRRTAGVRR